MRASSRVVTVTASSPSSAKESTMEAPKATSGQADPAIGDRGAEACGSAGPLPTPATTTYTRTPNATTHSPPRKITIVFNARMTDRIEFEIEEDQAGTRLDRALADALGANASRSRAKALIETGHARIDGATITDPSRKVKTGERVALDIPAPEAATQEAEDIPLVVLHEDAHLIVIDKPAGLVVHPAPGHAGGTLVNALLAHCKGSLSGIGGVERPGIVHRLDKDTSGLMVAAKTDAAHRDLAAQFEAHTVERVYAAIVKGAPRPANGEIEGNIGRNPRDRKKMAVVRAGGKQALTRYRTLEVLAGGKAALVECRLATGRTHQIRVHLASIGCPLLGDPTYARKAAGALDFDRQALDAFTLGFRHPADGTALRFVRPYAPDFTRFLTRLRGGTAVPQ
jgi:23S rRNA pseudouridine1911/1915/1917 synthase